MNNLNRILALLYAINFIKPDSGSQDRRLNTIEKGALSLLLKENVRYETNHNSFVIAAAGQMYYLSRLYVDKYLGSDALAQIENRNKDAAVDVSNYPVDLIEPIPLEENTDSEALGRNLVRLEDILSTLYGDVVHDHKTLSSLTENSRLRQDNQRLQKELEEARDLIEELKAEIDKFNILMIRSRGDINSSYHNGGAEVHIDYPTYDEYDNQTDEDENVEEYDNSPYQEYEEEEDDDDIIDEDDDDEDEEDENDGGYEEDDDDDNVNVESIMTDINMERAVYNDERTYQKTPSSETEEETTEPEEQPAPPTPAMDDDDEMIEGQENAKYGIFPYKEDDIYQMAKQEFVFNYSQITLMDSEDSVVDMAEIMIVPLVTNVHYPRILVWVAYNENTKTLWFKNAKNGVKINCGSFNILLKAKMNGPKFKSYITLAEDDNFPYKCNVQTTNLDGSKGHLYINYDDQKIHICPVTFKNDETGFANFIYCIEDEGELVQCGDNSEGDAMIEEADEPTKIMARWQDNILFGTVSAV